MSDKKPVSTCDFQSLAWQLGVDLAWDDIDENGQVDQWELYSTDSQNSSIDLAEVGYLENAIEKFLSVDEQSTKSDRQIVAIPAGELVYSTWKPFDEYLQKLRVNDGSVMTLKVPMAEIKSPVDAGMISGLKLNEDEHQDFLLLFSYETYAQVDAYAGDSTISFIIKVLGNDATDAAGAPSPEHIGLAKFVDSYSVTGHSMPVRRIEVEDVDGDGVDDISIYVEDRDSEKSSLFQYSSSSSEVDPARNIERNMRALNSVLKLQSSLNSSFTNLTAHEAADKDVGTQVESMDYSNRLLLNGQILPALKYLHERTNEILKGKKDIDKYDAAFCEHLRKIDENSFAYTYFNHEDLKHELTVMGRARELFFKAAQEYRWKGEPLGAKSHIKMLEQMADPDERKEFFVSLTGHMLMASSQKGGLMGGMVEELNRTYVDKYGFSDPIELFETIPGIPSPRAFMAKMEDYNAEHGAEIQDYVGSLAALNGGAPVREWDVPYLHKKLISEEIGGDVPKLKFGDGFAVMKRFFKDMGADLDSEPFSSNIVFDTSLRKNKETHPVCYTVDGGKKAIVCVNFDENEEITLEQFSIIIHETTHAVNTVLASRDGLGSVMMGVNGQPKTWTEGVAVGMQKMVWEKGWMDRYLSHIEQFSDEPKRESMSKIMSAAEKYSTMKLMARALWEIRLYQDTAAGKSREEMLRNWSEIVNKYLHVGTVEDGSAGDVYTVPHFLGAPIYYISYTGGAPTADRALQPLVRALQDSSESKIRNAGSLLLDLLSKGASCSKLEDYDRVIESWNL